MGQTFLQTTSLKFGGDGSSDHGEIFKYTGCIVNTVPPWPEKMGNRTIKTKLFMKRYIQYDLFELKM